MSQLKLKPSPTKTECDLIVRNMAIQLSARTSSSCAGAMAKLRGRQTRCGALWTKPWVPSC